MGHHQLTMELPGDRDTTKGGTHMANSVDRYLLTCEGCSLLEYCSSLESAGVVGNLHRMETAHEEVHHRTVINAVSPLTAAEEQPVQVPPEVQPTELTAAAGQRR